MRAWIDGASASSSASERSSRPSCGSPCVQIDAAQVEQHVRSQLPRGQRPGQRLELLPRGGRVAREVESLGELVASTRDGRLVLRRRHPHGELLQFGRRPGGSARRNGLGRPVERGGGRLVRPGRRERQVPRALLGVGEALGEPCVHTPPAARRGGLVDPGREQRVIEAHDAVTADSHDPLLLGRPERVLVDERGRRAGQAGGDEKCLARLGRAAD